ncbi:hypothetical protein ACFYUV_06490 [Nonomuraea sp. NPDC003560]|uniref:hypothetical protein n=1 Tax=Nonomuraea sp. NPDC003560 TaxID=3364341 RepID=UPI0036CF46D8
MGYTVTCHPEVDGINHRPDFRAEKDGGAVYVETRSASSSNVAVGADARVNTLYASLDKLDSPNFFLWINVERQGGGPLRARPLRSTPARWIDDWAGEVSLPRQPSRYAFAMYDHLQQGHGELDLASILAAAELSGRSGMWQMRRNGH